jgi:hypothetical protein
MICSSLNLLVLMSIILRVDGPLGKMTGTVYRGQVNEVKNRRFANDAKSNAGQLTGALTQTVRNPGSGATGVQKRPTVGQRPPRNPNLGK